MADCNYGMGHGDEHEACGYGGYYCGNDCPKLEK